MTLFEQVQQLEADLADARRERDEARAALTPTATATRSEWIKPAKMAVCAMRRALEAGERGQLISIPLGMDMASALVELQAALMKAGVA
jgi:hypothetical protein